MTPRHSALGISAVIAVAAAAIGCSSGTSNVLLGAPDWRDRYEDAARQPWIYALSSDHLVSADRVEFIDATTDPVGDVPYVIYETRTDATFDPPKGLELTVRGDQLRIFESLGTDERPSTFNDSGASDVMLLLDRSDLDPESRKRLDTDLHLSAAFTVDVTRDVEFLGPFAADIESELDAARELVGRQKQSEYDFLVELASVREDDRDPKTGRFTAGVLAEIEAEQERHRDPFHVWEQTPPDQRGIDPEVTPPHIMEKVQQARVFVQVDGRWPEGTALRILTDEGVALQVALQGFSDGYDIAVPPGSDWQVQILDGDMNVLDDPQARVNVTQWAGAEAVMVTVTPERLEVATISLAEFGRLRDASSVPAVGRRAAPGGGSRRSG